METVKKLDYSMLLRQYREQNMLTVTEMAKRVYLSKSHYNRIELGTAYPSLQQIYRIDQVLGVDHTVEYVIIPPPPLKWYQSRKWRWIKPILYTYLFLTLLMEGPGYKDGMGEAYSEDGLPFVVWLFIMIPICGVYWYYYPPEWPFKKRKKDVPEK